MGFPYAGINITRPPKTIILLVDLLCHIRFMAVVALNHLGLSSPPVDDVHAIVQPSPSTLIKKRLPAVEYCDFLHKIRREEDEDTVCAICLNGFERRHEIRELPNCCHAFHRKCVDGWVDEGKITCPLCRSMMFPEKMSRADL